MTAQVLIVVLMLLLPARGVFVRSCRLSPPLRRRKFVCNSKIVMKENRKKHTSRPSHDSNADNNNNMELEFRMSRVPLLIEINVGVWKKWDNIRVP